MRKNIYKIRKYRTGQLAIVMLTVFGFVGGMSPTVSAQQKEVSYLSIDYRDLTETQKSQLIQDSPSGILRENEEILLVYQAKPAPSQAILPKTGELSSYLLTAFGVTTLLVAVVAVKSRKGRLFLVTLLASGTALASYEIEAQDLRQLAAVVHHLIEENTPFSYSPQEISGYDYLGYIRQERASQLEGAIAAKEASPVKEEPTRPQVEVSDLPSEDASASTVTPQSPRVDAPSVAPEQPENSDKTSPSETPDRSEDTQYETPKQEDNSSSAGKDESGADDKKSEEQATPETPVVTEKGAPMTAEEKEALEIQTRRVNEQEVDFDTVVVEDPTMLKTDPEVVETEGTNGYSVVEVSYALIDGEEVELSKEVIETIAPVNRVVKRGTKEAETPVSPIAPETPVETPVVTDKGTSLTVAEKEEYTVQTRQDKENVVPFNVEYINDDSMLADSPEVVETEGVNGYDLVTTSYHTNEDGTETVLSKEVNETVAPVTKVIRRGTKILTEKGQPMTAEEKEALDIQTRRVNEQEVPFETVIIEDSTMLKTDPEITETEGVDGYSVVEVSYALVNGEEVELSKKVIETIAPTNRVIKRGTKEAEAPVETKTRRVRKNIVEFTTDIIEDPTVLDNTPDEVIREGVNGYDVVEVTVAVKNGQETLVSEKTVETVAPVTKQIRRGTKPNFAKGSPLVAEELPVAEMHKVTFYDANGTVLSEEVVLDGKGAKMPAAPKVEGKDFTGWDTAVNSVTSDLEVRPTYETKTYLVTYYGADSKPIKSEMVAHGEFPTPPNVTPTLEGYRFTGWTYDGLVKSKLNIYPGFEKLRDITITFDMDGESVPVVVKQGETVSYPTPRTIEGKNFIRWNNTATSFEKDTTVTAEYAAKTYTITFLNEDGSVAKRTTVAHGENVTVEPVTPDKVGYRFVGWLGTRTNITSDQTLKATFEKVLKDVTVQFVAETSTGTNLQSIASKSYKEGSSVSYPSTPTIEGYTFDHWSVENAKASENLVLKAIYTKNQYSVTVRNEAGTTVQTIRVAHGDTVTPQAVRKSGYTLTGFRTSDGQSVGLSNITIKKDTVLTPVYDVNTYTVKFFNKDGGLLKTETVEHGKAASAPTAPTVTGKTFTGWSKDFGTVYTDLNVYAQYEDAKATNVTVKYIAVSNDGQTWNVGTQELAKGSDYTVGAPTSVEKAKVTGKYYKANDIRFFGQYRLAGWQKVSESDTEVTMKAIMEVDSSQGWQVAQASTWGTFQNWQTETDISDKTMVYRYRHDLIPEFLRLANEYRASVGAGALTLIQDSTFKSDVDVRVTDLMYSYQHKRPDGSSWLTAYNGLVSAGGENILAGTKDRASTSQGALTAWLNSTSHRLALESNDFTKTTISVIETQNGFFWVQNFFVR